MTSRAVKDLLEAATTAYPLADDADIHPTIKNYTSLAIMNDPAEVVKGR